MIAVITAVVLIIIASAYDWDGAFAKANER